MSARAAIEVIILHRLRLGPVYVRTFHAGMPVVRDLIDRGFLRRVAPAGSAQKNMVELTDAGLHRLARRAP